MKIKNLLLLATGAATGYVFGAKAGRERYELLKERAAGLLHDPKVQEGVSTVASKVSESADKLGPASGLVKGAASQVKNAVSNSGSTTSSQSYDVPAGGSPVTPVTPVTPVDPEFGGVPSDGDLDNPRRADDSTT